MQFCTYCSSYFSENILDHIERCHKPETEKNNKGKLYCPLCKVRVASRQKHYCSKLHRWNLDKNAVDPQNYAEGYIKHYEKIYSQESKDEVDKDQDHPFWIAARQELSKKDYQLVKEYIYGSSKGKRGNARNGRKGRAGRKRTNIKHRNIRRGRFSRVT